MLKKSVFLGGLTAIIIAVFFAGTYFGYKNRPEVEKITNLFNKQEPTNLSNLDFNPFWKTWNVIQSKYVSNDGLSEQDMIWGSVSGLVASLDDPHSVFFPPKEAEYFESNVRGDFEGVGIEIGIRDGILTVISPLKGTPAEKAGIKAGDKIVKIDEELSADITIDEAVALIRGERGTEVTFMIIREGEGEPLNISVTRDVVEIPSLETEIKGDVFVISLYNFSGNSTYSFRKALREMIEAGKSKLIIDLRWNPGGYLEAAIDMASWFLPTGKIVAREQFSDESEVAYRSRGYDIFGDKIKVVVLVNGGSASSAEIFAGALREHGVATLVGEQTYGKGSIQELIDIGGGSSLKLTIARWLTPNGISISKEGLTPDVEVEFLKEDVDNDKDPQMDKAIEIINSL